MILNVRMGGVNHGWQGGTLSGRHDEDASVLGVPSTGSRWKVEARSLGELRSYRRATTVGEQAHARELAASLVEGS